MESDGLFQPSEGYQEGKLEVSGVDSRSACDGTPSPGSLASQLCPLGPKDRCTPSQAQAMGQQVLALIAMHESNKSPLPYELQNTFDIFHRCLAIAYATFFLNLYSKANAPCILCHGCKSLYPPGQYIHHVCLALPPNIAPCRSRMWRRCLVPLVSPDIDRLQQKQRWKYVIEKFSHASMGVVRRNPLPTQTEVQLLEMPECKRGRFVKQPAEEGSKVAAYYMQENGTALVESDSAPPATLSLSALVSSQPSSPASSRMLLDVDVSGMQEENDLSSCAVVHASTPISLQQTKFQDSGSACEKALGLAEQLVSELRALQQELVATKSKLKATEEQLKAVTVQDSLQARLVQALMAKERLEEERDCAVEQRQAAEERAEKLKGQLDQFRMLALNTNGNE